MSLGHLSPSPARSSKAPSSSSLPSPFGASSSSSETANKPPSFPFFRKASKHGHSGTHTPSSANSEYAPSTAPLLGPSRPDILSHSRRPSEDTVTQSQHAVPTQATGTVDDPEAATTSDTSAGPTQTRFEDSDEDSGQEDLGQVQSGWYMTSGVEPNRYFEGAPPDHGFPSQPNSAHPTSAPGSSYPTGSLDMYERPRSPVRSAPAIQDAWPHSARSHPTSPLSRGSMDSYMPADTEAEGSRRTGPLYEDEDDSEDERPVELNMTRRRGTHSTTLSTPSSTPSSP
ncbi:hypothetical protein SISNIDRAFT_117953 [Sistotremastrum niveocremeum HHB9708]|uniref:Uncharacterized protein n=2 Tax=Sistotremastraceae TaxID=3402574 RepID=A0A164TPC0_9AGAM|nr:hypothetical protein SISNIDRAFT_117953 [Sistotremastrum niveocremeum HHB9708]KZT42196.1 hypothetical protein SISSUDRAFT_113002 [Sistotremastrum suecicum HHB10207 ss-3]